MCIAAESAYSAESHDIEGECLSKAETAIIATSQREPQRMLLKIHDGSPTLYFTIPQQQVEKLDRG